jgi:hypothetical protein
LRSGIGSSGEMKACSMGSRLRGIGSSGAISESPPAWDDGSG